MKKIKHFITAAVCGGILVVLFKLYIRAYFSEGFKIKEIGGHVVVWIFCLALLAIIINSFSNIFMRNPHSPQHNGIEKSSAFPIGTWEFVDDELHNCESTDAEWRCLITKDGPSILIPADADPDNAFVKNVVEKIGLVIENSCAFLNDCSKMKQWEPYQTEIARLKLDQLQFIDTSCKIVEATFSDSPPQDARLWKCTYEADRFSNLGFEGS